MYKFYRILLQIRYPECSDFIKCIRKARSYEEAGCRAREAAAKFQRIAAEDGGLVTIVRVEENNM